MVGWLVDLFFIRTRSPLEHAEPNKSSNDLKAYELQKRVTVIKVIKLTKGNSYKKELKSETNFI